MTAYLIEHPPASKQYRNPRRATVSGVIVIHTAENAPDYVATDGGADAVARWIASRPDPGSYHELVDSDSAILVVPYGYEAFHDATGSNPHSLSVSVATRADLWSLAPKAWRDGAIEQAARAAARQARWVKATTGIVVPATRITRDESERRVPGFIAHAQRDPARRTDPGRDFPWAAFLARYRELMAPTAAPSPPTKGADLMIRIGWLTGEPTAAGNQTDQTAAHLIISATDAGGKSFDIEARWLSPTQLAQWRYAGVDEVKTRVAVSTFVLLGIPIHGGPFRQDGLAP